METTTAKSRRSKGQGSLYKRGDGKWVATVPYKDPVTGATRRKSFLSDHAGKGAKKNVEDKRDAWKATLNQPIKKQDKTVGDLLDGFLSRFQHRVTAGQRSISSLLGYKWAAEHLMVGLGGTPAADLSVDQIDEFLKVKEEGTKTSRALGKRSVRQLRLTLSKAMAEAVHRREIRWNPAAASEPIAAAKSTKRALTDRQVATLLRATVGHRLEPAIRLSLSLGPRPGEVLGLRWSDFNAEKGTLRIERSANKAGGDLRLGNVKTPTSRRTLPLAANLVEMLEAHGTQLADDLSARGKVNPQNLIFPSLNGTLTHPDNYRHAIAKLGEQAGIANLTPHLFRHTAATRMQKEGIPPLIIQRILGHSDFRTSAGYIDTNAEDLRSHLDKLASLVFGDNRN